MKHEQIIATVLSFCNTLRLSRSKTLSELVCAATKLSQASLAQLGRWLAGEHPVAVEHCITRVDRVVGNPRIEPIQAMEGLTPVAGPAPSGVVGRPRLGGHSSFSMPGLGRSVCRRGPVAQGTETKRRHGGHDEDQYRHKYLRQKTL